jgi:hypothetical protein
MQRLSSRHTWILHRGAPTLCFAAALAGVIALGLAVRESGGLPLDLLLGTAAAGVAGTQIRRLGTSLWNVGRDGTDLVCWKGRERFALPATIIAAARRLPLTPWVVELRFSGPTPAGDRLRFVAGSGRRPGSGRSDRGWVFEEIREAQEDARAVPPQR